MFEIPKLESFVIDNDTKIVDIVSERDRFIYIHMAVESAYADRNMISGEMRIFLDSVWLDITCLGNTIIARCDDAMTDLGVAAMYVDGVYGEVPDHMNEVLKLIWKEEDVYKEIKESIIQ